MIRFDNGIVKAGRTDDFGRRYREHRLDAGRFGLKITDSWISPQIEQTRHLEWNLLRQLRQFGPRTRSGREYFRDLPYSIAQAIAYRMITGQCPGKSRYRCNDCFHFCGTALAEPRVIAPLGYLDMWLCDFHLDCGFVIRGALENDDLRPGGPFPINVGPRLNLVVGDCQFKPKDGTRLWPVYGADDATSVAKGHEAPAPAT